MASSDELYPNGPMDIPGEPMHSKPPKKSKKFNPKVIIALIAVALLGGAAFLIMHFANKDKAPANNQQTQTETNIPEADNTPADVPTASENKKHTADFPRVEFTYPSNWNVSENDRGIRIESPEFSYKKHDNTTTTGNFRLYIRQGARSVDSSFIGRGVATKPSQTLTYSDPAPGQRAETNLSFFGLDSPDHFAFLFIAGNFSLNVGDTLGPDYGKEPETFIISGGYSQKSLTDDMATNPVSLDEFDQKNAYTQAIEILKSLKVY